MRNLLLHSGQQIVCVAKEKWKLRRIRIFRGNDRREYTQIADFTYLLGCTRRDKLGSCSFNFLLLNDSPVVLGNDLRHIDYPKGLHFGDAIC